MSAEGFCNFDRAPMNIGEKGDNHSKSICNHPTPVPVFKKYLDIHKYTDKPVSSLAVFSNTLEEVRHNRVHKF